MWRKGNENLNIYFLYLMIFLYNLTSSINDSYL